MSATDVTKESKSPGRRLAAMVIQTLGSMRLAVALLVLLGLLTWLGTLAQIGDGLWKVQKEYFESWFLIADLELGWWGQPVLADESGRGFVLRIPLPGAYPVMALLFLNLMVGGMLRMKWSLRNIGVLVVHVGIALLLLAGFVKMEFSYSGGLALFEAPAAGEGDESRAYESSTFVSFHDYELALLKDRGDTVEERVVAESEVLGAVDGTVTLTGDGLPFKVQVHHWMERCEPQAKGPMVRTTAPVLDDPAGGPGVFLRQLPPLPERSANTAGAYVTVLTDAGDRFDGIVYGAERLPYQKQRFPFTFELDGARWAIDLRRVIYDLPFHVRLKSFVKRDHPGTLTAADYRSKVVIPEEGEREAQIYMNNPLRKDGFVMYQTSWGPQINGRPNGGPPWYSVFEVAENPSDKWPEYACWVIALGLILHFTMKLKRFLGSSTRRTLTQG
ncbi:MAG: cytochrome c biogenesis protein ResB [Planctomycetota bacterium]|nr:cytochrome c biogenesis protein ResB [Planctomycetota bacterium]